MSDTTKRIQVDGPLFSQFAAYVNDAPFAMEPHALEQYVARIRIGSVVAEAPELAPYKHVDYGQESWLAEQAGPVQVERSTGAVAVLPLRGAIDHHRSWFGDVFVDEIDTVLGSLVSNSEVGAIVLDWDSPGGVVSGVPELAEKIREYAKAKPIYSLSNASMYSAAYWLGSAATKTFVIPSGGVGSIGVWTAHIDSSKALEDMGWRVTLISAGKYKVEGNPFGPLEDEARAAIQSRIDEFYGMFTAGVAKNRGIRQATVEAGYGEGRTVQASAALAEGMVDGVATLGQLLGALVPRRKQASRAAAEAQIALAEVEE